MTSVASRRDNLPAQVSSFIGRERELEEMARLLRQHRLVTLTEPGGTGKTRLALRVGEAALEHFPDGVWLTELAPLTSPELVIDTIAKAISGPDLSPVSPLETLATFLSRKRLLLLLDNCEHLLDACAHIVASLLARCPTVTVLATSREPLAIGGEAVLRVPPLGLPDPAPALDQSHLLASDAVRLFVERAQDAEPSFRLTSVSAAPVVEICRRLDGIPLALELAAGRVRGMGVAYLSARLDDRFHLLTGGDRTGEPRQRTLAALIDWSYELLPAREQVVLRRLGIFRGGFSAEAAEAVCAGDYDDSHDNEVDAGARARAPRPGALPANAVRDDLTRLVDKSLVQLDQESGRYRLLETIHLYGRERLAAAGETNFISRQHFVFYLQLAEDGAALVGGPGQQVWFSRLEQEHDNFRAALGWAIQVGRGMRRRAWRWACGNSGARARTSARGCAGWSSFRAGYTRPTAGHPAPPAIQ
jgi:predicted ATPase